jgi:cytochrome c551/c552
VSHRIAFALFLAACAGSAPPPETKTATVAPIPAAAPAAAAPAAPVGPEGPADLSVPSITLSDDPAVVAQGKAVFEAKGCGGCHKFGEKLVGPDLKGVLDRRQVAWAEKMIRYPEKMTKEDPVAKGLLGALMVQMSDQGVSEAELTPLLSYVKSQGK